MTIPPDTLLPAALAHELSQYSLREFLTKYGSSSWLLVELDKRFPELRAGLLTATAKASSTMQPSVSVLGFQTQVVDPKEFLANAELTTRRFFAYTAQDLGAHLVRSPVFALQLKKRAGDAYQQRVSVGRALNKDVVLREASVSKFHAWFEVDDDGRYYVADAGSKNGTRVAGEPLEPKELVPVGSGQPLEFGSVNVTIVPPDLLHEAAR